MSHTLIVFLSFLYLLIGVIAFCVFFIGDAQEGFVSKKDLLKSFAMAVLLIPG